MQTRSPRKPSQKYQRNPRYTNSIFIIVSFLLTIIVFVFILFNNLDKFIIKEDDITDIWFWLSLPLSTAFYVFLFVISVVIIVSAPLAVLELILRAVNRTPIPSYFRDVASTRILKIHSNFSLLLRPFELDAEVMLIPDNVDIERFGSARYPPKNVGELWRREEAGIENEPVELFDAITTTMPQEMIGIGERHIGHLGGPGLYNPDSEDWLVSVREIMIQAEMIFFMPWSSDGTLKELAEIFSHELLGKTVFIIPPSYSVKTETDVVIIKPDDPTYSPYGINSFVYKNFIRGFDSNPEGIGPKTIREEYVKSKRYFSAKGYEYPVYYRGGCLFFYADREVNCSPIPYDDGQMIIFQRWRSEVLGEKTRCQP